LNQKKRKYLAHDAQVLVDDLASHELAVEKVADNVFALGSGRQKLVLCDFTVIAVASLQVLLRGLIRALQLGDATRLDGGQFRVVVQIFIFLENVILF
jgi:hypothetical protein